jgi:hypothetical protein
MSFLHDTVYQQFDHKDQAQLYQYDHFQTTQIRNQWEQPQPGINQVYYQSNECIDNSKTQSLGESPIYWTSGYQNNIILNEPDQTTQYSVSSNNTDPYSETSSGSFNELYASDGSSPSMSHAIDDNQSSSTLSDNSSSEDFNPMSASQNYFPGLASSYQTSSPTLLDYNGHTQFQDIGGAPLLAGQELDLSKIPINFAKPISKPTYDSRMLSHMRSCSAIDQNMFPLMMGTLPRKSKSISAGSGAGYYSQIQPDPSEENVKTVQLDYNGRKPRQWRNRKYRCSHCNLIFYDRELASYAAHIMQVERDHGTSGRRFKCTEPSCHWSKIGFVRKLEQQKHFTRKHGNPTFECRFWSPDGKEKYKGYRVCTTHWHADSGNRLRHERAVHRTVWNESLDHMEHLKVD